MPAPTREQLAPAPPATGDLNLMDALAQLTFAIQGSLAKRAAHHDLSLIQTRLLGVLRDRQPTMQELARLLDLDKSSVTGLIDRAELRRLVRRVPSSDDRRSVRVKLTSRGRRVIRQVVTAFRLDIDVATASLTSSDKDNLRSLTTRVITAHTAHRQD